MVGKQIKKFIKGTWHNVGSIESWLSDMALEGLLISDINKSRATFEQGERTKAEYRIKYLPYDIKEDETSITRTKLIELFGNYGWQKVCTYDDIYVFKSVDNESYKELPIFDFETSYFRRTLNKEILGHIGVAAVGILNIYLSVFSYGFPSNILHNGGMLQFFIVLISFLVPVILISKLLISKRRVKQEINHHYDWKTESRKRVIWTVLVIILGAAILLQLKFIYKTNDKLPLYNMNSCEEIALDDKYKDAIRLNDIEQSGESIELDKDNYIIHSSSFLAPEYYHLLERAAGSDYVEFKEPYIYVRYYELRFEIFSQSLIKDMAHYRYDILDKIESDFFDYVGGYTGDDYKELYLSKGNIVVSIDYRGNRTLEEVLKIVEEKLASQYKLHNLFDLH